MDPVAGPADHDQSVEAIEEWFVDRGIPHFIHDYSATEDVFTRAIPTLTAVFLFELVAALNLDWSIWLNLLAAAGGLLILGGIWALANRARGRRPLARPVDISTVELGVFVIAPAALPAMFGGQLRTAGLVALTNLALIGAIYLVTSYGVVPMIRWAAGQTLDQLQTLIGLVARALPLLLLFITFLFINAEVWQVAAGLKAPFLMAVAALFLTVGVVFLMSRIPREVADLGHFDSAAAVDRLVDDTPAAPMINERTSLPASPPLSRREWGNIGLVVLVSQGVQILIVSLTIGAFFVLFGLIAIPEATIEAWTATDDVHVVGSIELWNRPVVLSQELLRVSGFLASFTGLYFTVYAVTDDTYRREFFAEVTAELRQSLAVRAVYRAVVGH